MPLPLPTLDRLSYDELVSEARSSLPALAPGWTDYNAHDPGITLLELFAWLAEGSSYRLDHIPDQSYRAFLRLVGVVPRPAQVAETLLVFQATAAASLLPNAIRVQTKGGEVEFQTTAPLFVSDAHLKAVVSGVGAAYEDLTERNAQKTTGILPFSAKPKAGDVLYLGFDRALAPADTVVSLGVWTGNALADQVTRSRLAAEQSALEDEAARLCPNGLSPNQPDWREHYGARTVWEYYADNGQWRPLKGVADDTRALTLSGTVRFTAPGDPARGGVLPPTYDAYFIRCRLERGGYDCPPRLMYVALNAVSARHAVDVPPQTFRSTGRAALRFDLAERPVVSDSINLLVTLKNGVVESDWRAALAWDGVEPHERAYVLAPEAGTVVFGDGRFGRVPPAEANIKVDCQQGGGSSGNVAAGTLVALVPNQPTVRVDQPFAACGGMAAETLNEAKARAVRELATPTRAATLEDFEALALATPGVPLARAHAVSDYHPIMQCIPVSGSTTVVVLPPCPEQRPEPTAALLATVQRYLERRRVLTGEIHVIAPHYTTVSVSAHLQARPEVDRRALVREARDALERFFHPLHGGPEGRGWPIGRAVYRSELLALLNGVEGVAYVEELAWRADDHDSSSLCGTIAICPHGLVASGIHEISVNEGNTCHE